MIVVTHINDNQDQCTWKSDLPTLLSVCLISMEPDTVLRVMHNWGQRCHVHLDKHFLNHPPLPLSPYMLLVVFSKNH